MRPPCSWGAGDRTRRAARGSPRVQGRACRAAPRWSRATTRPDPPCAWPRWSARRSRRADRPASLAASAASGARTRGFAACACTAPIHAPRSSSSVLRPRSSRPDSIEARAGIAAPRALASPSMCRRFSVYPRARLLVMHVHVARG